MCFFKTPSVCVLFVRALTVCSLPQALRLRLASLSEAQRSAQSAQTERTTMEERLRSLQRALAVLETEKKDAERQAVRLEKDKNALRNTLDKVPDKPFKFFSFFAHFLTSATIKLGPALSLSFYHIPE